MPLWRISSIETKNGPMRRLETLFSERLLASQNIEQSGPYMNGVWKTALRKVPRSCKPGNILVLGVGLGGVISLLAKKYPNARICGLEWDETLIDLAKERVKTTAVDFICEDAGAFVKSTEKTFDLVLIDLFAGRDPSPCVSNPAFIENIQRISSGVICLNVYKREDILNLYQEATKKTPIIATYYKSLIGIYGT